MYLWVAWPAEVGLQGQDDCLLSEMGWSTCKGTRAQLPGPPLGPSSMRGPTCLPSSPGLHVLRCISDGGAWNFVFERRMHSWTLVLEVEVHVSLGFWSKKLSRIFGVRIH